jgi:hypothetical protein
MQINVSVYLEMLFRKLISSKSIGMEFSSSWLLNFPNKAGVYIIKDEKTIIYVGETGNLKGRMRDLFDSRNHTFRRNIGKFLFSDNAKFIPASSRLRFPEEIESLINDYMIRNLKILFIEIDLGRKELEEYIVNKENSNCLNRRQKRK